MDFVRGVLITGSRGSRRDAGLGVDGAAVSALVRCCGGDVVCDGGRVGGVDVLRVQERGLVCVSFGGDLGHATEEGMHELTLLAGDVDDELPAIEGSEGAVDLLHVADILDDGALAAKLVSPAEMTRSIIASA